MANMDENVESNKRGWTYTDRHGDTHINLPKVLKTFAIVVGVLLVLLIVNPFETVGRTERGVKTMFGAVTNDTIVQPGITFVVPIFGGVKKYSIVQRETPIRIEWNKNGAISGGDSPQMIGVVGKVIWRYKESAIPQLAKGYDASAIESQLNSTTIEAIKSAIGQYTVFKLAVNMGAISDITKTALDTKLTASGLPVEVIQVTIEDFDWSPKLDEQIEATIAAQQEVEKAKANADRTEQEQRTVSIQAEASARAQVAVAAGNLEAAELNKKAAITEAEGIAESNRIKATPTSLEFQRAEWAFQVSLERAKHLAPGVEVPMYIPLSPNGSAAVLQPAR
jgi:regulator of protease activity HflC (stomatin/prohibitin superfamily)